MPVGVQSRPSNFSMEIYFVKSISVSIERIHSTTSPFYSYVTWNFFDTNILDKKITSPLNWAYIMIYVPLKIFWGQHFGWNILRTVFLTRNWLRLLSIGICLTIFFCHSNRVWKQYFGQKNDFSPYLGHIFQCPCCLKIFWGNILCKKLTSPPYLGQIFQFSHYMKIFWEKYFVQETDYAPLSGATLELRRHKERGGWGWPEISGEGDKNMAGGGIITIRKGNFSFFGLFVTQVSQKRYPFSFPRCYLDTASTYLIFVTGTTGGACVKKLSPV